MSLCIAKAGSPYLSHPLLNKQIDAPDNECCGHSATHGGGERDPGVGKELGGALPLDREHPVCQSGPHVTGRVHGHASTTSRTHNLRLHSSIFRL